MTNDDWIADLTTMTCTNKKNGVVVIFKPCGKTYEGKIKDISMEQFAEWAKLPDGELHVQKTVEEAELVFLKAVFEQKEKAKH